MNDDFSWLDYDEADENAPMAADDSDSRPRPRRFLPRLPRSLSLPRLPRLRRQRADDAPAQSSATAVIAGRADRPVEELDDRLRALRQRTLPTAERDAKATQALHDVDDVLVTPELLHKPGGIISAAALSKAQQQQVEMLKDLVGAPPQSQGEQRSSRQLSFPSLSALPRFLAAAFMLLILSLPFASSDFSTGSFPPVAPDQDQANVTAAYSLLDNLSPVDHVLLAFEYGPTAAGELDLLADLMLRHILARGAKPVIVSSNPIAIVHAQNIINKINRSLVDSGATLVNNQDYYLLRYLPGAALGTRELSENFADLARFSAKGNLTSLQLTSLEQLSLILLIAESAEDIRNWAEQILPETEDARLLAVTGYAAQPLAQAYADSLEKIVALLVGMRDAYSYGEMLQSNFSALIPSQPALEPVSQEAPPPVENPPEDQPEAQPPVILEATETPFPTATTPPPTAIPATATATPPPTIIVIPATATPLPSNTPAPTAAPVLMVEIIVPRRVNIRRQPNTAADILALGEAGDTFEVLGSNADDSWYNILLPNGWEGWIAAILVEEVLVTDPANDSASAAPGRTLLRLDFPLTFGDDNPRLYQAAALDANDRSAIALLRDRRQENQRLEAMTLGTIAAVLVIVIGNLLSATSVLLRRRRPTGKE